MTAQTKRSSLRACLLISLAFAYFLVFPEDLRAIVGITTEFSSIVEVLLRVTLAIAPGLYGVAAAVILGVFATRVTAQILAIRAMQDRGTTTTHTTPHPPNNS